MRWNPSGNFNLWSVTVISVSHLWGAVHSIFGGSDMDVTALSLVVVVPP
jgi:hypothetical protein